MRYTILIIRIYQRQYKLPALEGGGLDCGGELITTETR